MDRQHRHQQHGDNRQARQAGVNPRNDKQRADHLGDDRRDQTGIRPKTKRIFDARQLFAEVQHLRQTVHVKQQQTAGQAQKEQPRIDPGLFFLRLTGSLLLLYVHGLPKVLHFSEELTRIEDPFGFGPYASLIPAIVAEVICPLFIIAGIYTRLACLPIIAVLLVAMLAVHPNWSIAEGQFGWLLLIIFTTLALTGPGQWRVQRKTTERFA